MKDVSAAVGNLTRPMADILRGVDASFRPVPTTDTFSYEASSGLRVDFLTPNHGRDSEEPRPLLALGTDAQPLRFLDFLIRDPEQAVLLYGTGVLVTVPAPQRFALHKLIVARRRRDGDPKRDKDIFQAQALLNALVERRPHELRDAWREAFGRGMTWQRLLGEGLGLVHPATRDRVVRTVGACRSVVPGLDIRFVLDRVGYDEASGEVRLFAVAGREGVSCVAGREVLGVLADGMVLDRAGCVGVVRRNRGRLEAAFRARYLNQPVEDFAGVRLSDRC